MTKKTTKPWFAELFYALKTLPRNPYLRHYIEKIARPQTLIRVVLGYVIGTITQIIFNWIIISSLLGIKTTLVFDSVLQATYLQQQSLLFLLAALVIPFIITVLLVGERRKNRLAFVQLTPISPYQITIGNLSRFFLLLLLVMVLHLPITLICLLTGNVELTYVFIMTCDLLIAALFFSVIILLADLFFYYEFKTGGYISGGLIIWMFLVFNFLGNLSPQFINSFLISPFQIMSRQGIQLLPLSVKFPYIRTLYYFEAMEEKNREFAEKINPLMELIEKSTEGKSAGLLLDEVMSKRPTSYSTLKNSIKDLDVSLKSFEDLLKKLHLHLQEQVEYYESHYTDKAKGSLYVFVPGKSTLQEFDKLLYQKKSSISGWSGWYMERLTEGLKRQDLEYVNWGHLWDFFEGRSHYREKYWGTHLEYEIKLHLQAGRRVMDAEELKNYLFVVHSKYHEMQKLELEDLDKVIKNIEKCREILLEKDSVYTLAHFHLSQYIPVTLQSARIATWWTKLDKSTGNKQLQIIREKFENLVSQIMTVKVPISLSNTNFIGSSLESRKIWLFFLYGNLMRFILFLASYVFICNNIFSRCSLDLSPSISFVFSCIFGIIFIQLSVNLNLTNIYDFLRYFRQNPFYMFSLMWMLLLVTLLPFLLLSNTISLSKMRYLRFWERVIVLFNPFLLVFVICFFLWYSRNINFFMVQGDDFFRGIPIYLFYMIICYEFARQWLRFRFSKIKSVLIAYVSIIPITIIVGLLSALIMLMITEGSIWKPDESIFFLMIICLVEIHFILVAIYFLKEWRKRKRS